RGGHRRGRAGDDGQTAPGGRCPADRRRTRQEDPGARECANTTQYTTAARTAAGRPVCGRWRCVWRWRGTGTGYRPARALRAMSTLIPEKLAIRRNDRALFVGATGSGKTTLAKAL